MEIIKEIQYSTGENTYTIKVIFDGEDYSACCYLDDEPVNKTVMPGNRVSGILTAESPEIENLIYILKEDLKDKKE